MSIFFIRVSDRDRYDDSCRTNCCARCVGGNPGGDAFNKQFCKSPLPHLLLSMLLKPFEKKKPSSPCCLNFALENLPVRLGAKCSSREFVCSRFSSKGVERISGIAKHSGGAQWLSCLPLKPRVCCTGLA